MVKAVVLLTKREDLSSEQFRSEVDKNLPALTSLPGLQRMVINYVPPTPGWRAGCVSRDLPAGPCRHRPG
jgi:hypothetical protein